MYATWLKLLLGLFLGAMLIWVGLVGRPGALLAAFITPGALQGG